MSLIYLPAERTNVSTRKNVSTIGKHPKSCDPDHILHPNYNRVRGTVAGWPCYPLTNSLARACWPNSISPFQRRPLKLFSLPFWDHKPKSFIYAVWLLRTVLQFHNPHTHTCHTYVIITRTFEWEGYFGHVTESGYSWWYEGYLSTWLLDVLDGIIVTLIKYLWFSVIRRNKIEEKKCVAVHFWN